MNFYTKTSKTTKNTKRNPIFFLADSFSDNNPGLRAYPLIIPGVFDFLITIYPQKLLTQGYTADKISNDTFNDLLTESASELKEYYKDKQKFEYDRKESTALKISEQLDLDVGKTSVTEKVIDLKKVSIRV